MLAERVKDLVTGPQLALDPSAPLVLMVSGGSDSTALAYLMADLRAQGAVGPLRILHVNHHLRGEASDGDAAFVHALAEVLGIPCTVADVDVAALVKAEDGNLEAIARRERYECARTVLAEACAACGMDASAGRVMTAHTADDRVENFYMRSIVGTGPGGFRSMEYRSVLPGGLTVLRPLLSTSRDELRAWIAARAGQEAAATHGPSGARASQEAAATHGPSGVRAGQEVAVVRDPSGALWREDATNAQTDRFRTFVRHTIVPLAKERNPKLLQTLTRTMDLIADEDDYLALQAAEASLRFAQWDDSHRTCLLAPGFGELPVVIKRRAVFAILNDMLGKPQGTDIRVEAAAVQAVLAGFREDGSAASGYKANIQGNLAVSANKAGVRIEPMETYRARTGRR